MSRISHAAVALFAAATLCAAIPAAQAMTLSAPAGIRPAIEDAVAAEDVRYVCRDWCGVGGCYRRCWWEPRRRFYRQYRWRRPRW